MAAQGQFPHLTDTDSVRREADQQYGGLNDAAAFQQAHRAGIDPNVEAAALRHRNPDETARVQNDLSLAQAKVDEVHGEGTYRVIDAAVRGDALSTVVEDQYGRPQHITVGWTDRWRSVVPKGAEAEARANASAEAAKGRLGAEARAEVTRLVEEATGKILSRVNELLGSKNEEVQTIREQALAEAMDDLTDEDRARINAGLKVEPRSSGDSGSGKKKQSGATGGSPSSTEGNDTSETGAGKTTGSETDGGEGGDEASEASWPREHVALDEIGQKNNVEFGARDNLDTKIEKLEAAGVKPPPEE